MKTYELGVLKVAMIVGRLCKVYLYLTQENIKTIYSILGTYCLGNKTIHKI